MKDFKPSTPQTFGAVRDLVREILDSFDIAPGHIGAGQGAAGLKLRARVEDFLRQPAAYYGRGAAALATTIPPAMPSLPDMSDFISHRMSWLAALVSERDRAGGDDAAYWQHEINAFKRAFDAIDPYGAGRADVEPARHVPRP